MFWSCSKLTNYWSNIFNILSQALIIILIPDPLTALFGYLPTPTTQTSTHCVNAFTSLLARHAIVLKWKHVSPPSSEHWIREVLHCIYLEKLRHCFHWTPLTKHGVPYCLSLRTLTFHYLLTRILKKGERGTLSVYFRFSSSVFTYIFIFLFNISVGSLFIYLVSTYWRPQKIGRGSRWEAWCIEGGRKVWFRSSTVILFLFLYISCHLFADRTSTFLHL